jgi:hypothetical protein
MQTTFSSRVQAIIIYIVQEYAIANTKTTISIRCVYFQASPRFARSDPGSKTAAAGAAVVKGVETVTSGCEGR